MKTNPKFFSYQNPAVQDSLNSTVWLMIDFQCSNSLLAGYLKRFISTIAPKKPLALVNDMLVYDLTQAPFGSELGVRVTKLGQGDVETIRRSGCLACVDSLVRSGIPF